jgi:hypothetical protein
MTKITKEKLATAWMLFVVVSIVILIMSVIYSLAGLVGILGLGAGALFAAVTHWAIDTLT